MISSFGFLWFPMGTAMKMAPAGQIILKCTWTRGGRSRDLASENREIFQPTLSECKSGRERAPGRPLKPLEPPRIAGRPAAPAGGVLQ